MFHDGDLNGGISRAITEGKLVACFVRSDNDESRGWELALLSKYKEEINKKAVVLKIEFGSQESGFLNAFCPITKAPTLVMINNGTVVGKVEAGLSTEDFDRSMRGMLGMDGGKEAEEEAPVSQQQDTSVPATASSSAATQAPPQSNPPSSSTQQESPTLQSILPDRAAKQQEEKAKREAAEKAERTARANARRKEAEEAYEHHRGKDTDKGKSKAATEATEKDKARKDWLLQQKHRKDEAKKDRERVLAQIEADKLNRKARSQQAKEEAIASSSPLSPSADAAARRQTGAGGMCSLVIRLFDGSSIKGRFEPSTTLATGVRNWMKETASTTSESKDIPFTFKQILAPRPSRTIEISEENESLQSLGLVPNATLVLVPVQGYTEAYTGGGGRGYMSTALHAAYGVAGTASNVAGYFLSYLPGFGSTAATSEHAAAGATPASDAGNTGSIKVRSLADRRAEAAKKDTSAEFYNGNSSAFEGRKDDDGEGK